MCRSEVAYRSAFSCNGVEIKPVSVDCLRDQDKIGNTIPVVSVRSRGKQMGKYGTSSRIYTVDYEIKGDRDKMLGKTVK